MTLTLPQRRQCYHRMLNIMTSTLIVWVLLIPSSLALPTSPIAVAAFVPASRSTSRWYSSSRSRIFHDNPITSIRPLQLSEKDDYSLNHYSDCNDDHIQFQDLDANDQHTNRIRANASSKQHNEQYRTSPESLTPAKTRRQFFQQQIIASSATLFPTYVNAASTSTDEGTGAIDNYFSLRNNNNIPYAQRKQLARQQQQQQQQFAKDRQKANDKAISSSKKLTWTPFVNVNKWDSVETCLLEMLPVRNGVFRKLQDLIEELEICEGKYCELFMFPLLVAGDCYCFNFLCMVV